MKSSILTLLDGRYLTLGELSELLDRQKDGLRNNYLIPMILEGQILQEYPNIKNHPKQRYIAATTESAE